jgi:hypothetical protein
MYVFMQRSANKDMALSDTHKNPTGDRPKHGYDIFISHSSRIDVADRELVDELAGALRHRGFNVFLDRTHLAKGQKLFETLYEAISESTAGLIICTRQAHASNWVGFEVQEMELRRLCGAMCIVALRLEPDCQIPLDITPSVIIDPPDRFDLTDVADRVAHAARNCLSSS